MGRPTVHDIAKEAGVSLATVDRVLNARPGVRDATVKRVKTAIERLGYKRDLMAANLARQRHYRFCFVLPMGDSQFVTTITEALEDALRSHVTDRVSLDCLPVPAHDPHGVTRVLSTVHHDQYDGVAIMTPETPQVRDAVAHLKSEGIPVVALVSDLPNSDRDHFVGIDNTAAGRTAGMLMGRFLKGNRGKVMVVTSSMLARDSLERRIGFDQVIREDFPDVEVLPSAEAHDDADRMARVVATAFKHRPDIAGVYSLSSGNTALLAAIRALNLPRHPVIIAHELTPVSRRALLDREIDAVITQNVGHLVRSAIRVLRAKCDKVEIDAAQERIRIDILLRENVT